MNEVPDDSALLIHGSRYDPVKAREYYLRTRQLKGRRRGSAQPLPKTRRSSSGTLSKMTPSRRKELEEQRAALEKRLDRLKEVLAQLVNAAKKRSGIDVKANKLSDNKTTTPTKDTSSDKPLTEEQKREKRKDSKERYEKEQRMGLSGEVQELQIQVKDVLTKIKKAAADAQRQGSSQSKSKTASNGR